MITPRIRALFQFIEYLHSNIESFNQYNELIKELEQLDKERNQLKPQNNYRDKQQFDKVKGELESKFKTLQDNTTNLIKAKARDLNVCNFDNEPNYSFNGVETEIRPLKDNFCNDDLPEIFKHKSQYLEYRSQTHGTFLSLQFFFNELDELAKSLFDYFKDTQQNEFELFEAKTVLVNSFEGAVKELGKGSKVNLRELSQNDKDLILDCNAYLNVINYFDNVKLHPLGNKYLIGLVKKDKELKRSGKSKNRPYHIQDELAIGGRKEATEEELLLLFNKKFDDQPLGGYLKQQSFAKNEFEYKSPLWSKNQIKERFPISKQWLELLESIMENKTPQLHHNNDPKSKKEFKEFFYNTPITQINKIQNAFKDSADKDLAMLVYILTEISLVKISLNSKTTSRKHFIEALIGTTEKDMSYINRSIKGSLKDKNGNIHEPNYREVKKELETILDSKVV